MSAPTSISTTVATPPRHWCWEPSGRPVAVHLSFDVIDGINQAIAALANDPPVRGAELGGLLLGSCQRSGARLTAHVEAFEVFPSSYPRGASWLLDPEGIEEFGQTVAEPREVQIVGFFRSHTRKDLFLSDDDQSFLAEFFPGPDNVFLLVKPFITRPPLGGFFYRDGAAIHGEKSCHEFPFDRRELGGGAAPPVVRAEPEQHTARATAPPRAPEAAPVTPPAPKQEPPPPPVAVTPTPLPAADEEETALEVEDHALPAFATPPLSRPMSPMTKIWIGLGILALAAVALFGYVQYSSRSLGIFAGRGKDRSPLAPVAGTLRLSATEEPHSIVLTWDRDSPIVEAATGAELSVAEGSFHKDVDISADQLRLGRLVYSRPQEVADTLTFRLKVKTSQGEPFTESLQFISHGGLAPARRTSPLKSEQSARIASAPSPVKPTVIEPLPPPPALPLSADESKAPVLPGAVPAPPPKPAPVIVRPAPRREP